MADPLRQWAVPELPPFRIRDMRARRPSWPQMKNWLQQPWRAHPVGLATGLLASGQVDMAMVLGKFPPSTAMSTADLRLVAVRDSDRQRVVLDQFGSEASLMEAVAASCAIPGYARSVMIDGENFLDGGLHSPTNADLLVESGVDLAIVISPMTGRHRRSRRRPGLVQRWAEGRLQEELRLLEANAIPAVVISPEPYVGINFGPNLLDGANLATVVRDSFLTTGGQIGREPWRSGLHVLDSRGVLSRIPDLSSKAVLSLGETG